MTNGNPAAPGGEDRVLLVAVRPEEEETLARGLAATGLGVRLDAVAGPAEVVGVAEAGAVRAILCAFAVYAGLREAVPQLFHEEAAVPTLVLIPPGYEESAADLLAREGTEVLLQAGNYRPLLRLWLARVLQRGSVWREELGHIVRHEINNPLTGVLGNAEMILAEAKELSPEARTRLETIVQLAVRMRDVVKTLEGRLRRRQKSLKRQLLFSSVEPEPFLHELTR